jgi:formiminotetrahydrofolate cyclodeaminase
MSWFKRNKIREELKQEIEKSDEKYNRIMGYTELVNYET